MPVTACFSLLVAVAHKREGRIKSVRKREKKTRENEMIIFFDSAADKLISRT